jgi:C1A family cysteine protease
MKTSLMLYLAALLGAASASSGVVDQSEVRSMHSTWMVKHGKSYATEEEKESRFNIFMKNLEMILEHNMRFSLGHTSYTMEMNAHGDMTFEEWKTAKLNWKASAPSKTIILSMFDGAHAGVHTTPLIRGLDLPATVDWRSKGAVTPVKDQGTFAHLFFHV